MPLCWASEHSDQTSRHLLCDVAGMELLQRMGNMYQWVSLEMRIAGATSLGFLLLYLLSMIVTITWFWCYAHFGFSLLGPHHFVVTRPMSSTRYYVHSMLTNWSLSCIASWSEVRIIVQSGNIQQQANYGAHKTMSTNKVGSCNTP